VLSLCLYISYDDEPLVGLDYTHVDVTTDYYALLGVEVDAPASEVKAAFKKLALQYHPDVYKGEDAHERMRVLLQAYQTLNDPTARREYDVTHRASKSGGPETARTGHTARPAPRRTRANTSEVSPSARRDRQRHYDFPTFQGRGVTHVDLIDTSYELTPNETQTLQQQGMIRGVAPQTPDATYYCHRCHHHWSTSIASSGGQNLPFFCPKCHASDWTEYLLLRCIHCCAIFESEQIRYEVGTYTYGKQADERGLCPPYELFPLCPYCGTARWCPAEDARVADLRSSQARRDTMMRLFWIGATVLVLVVLSVLALNVLR